MKINSKYLFINHGTLLHLVFTVCLQEYKLQKEKTAVSA